MKYLIGIIAITIAMFMVIKTEWFVQNFGRIAWAEQHLGVNGGTRLMYKLLGVITIFLTLMIWTGAFGRFFLGTFGKLFGA